MIRFTCQSPQVRANKIKDGLQILNYHENEFLHDFGMRVANEMVQVDGKQSFRVLSLLYR